MTHTDFWREKMIFSANLLIPCKLMLLKSSFVNHTKLICTAYNKVLKGMFELEIPKALGQRINENENE